MNGEKQGLTHRLQMDVERLAGDIGERNVFAPEALQRAATYIENEWVCPSSDNLRQMAA